MRRGAQGEGSPYDHALYIHEKVVASACPSGSGRFQLCVYFVGADIEASVLGFRPARSELDALFVHMAIAMDAEEPGRTRAIVTSHHPSGGIRL